METAMAMDTATATATRDIFTEELAYAQVRELIMDAVLLPNHHHLVKTLADRIDQRVEDVQAAATRLHSEGLICLEPRGGFWVVPMAPATITETFRRASDLEARASYIAAVHGPTAIGMAALDDSIQAMDHAMFRHDRKLWARANHHFHRSLVQCSGHADLIAAALPLSEPLHRARMVSLALGTPPINSVQETAMLVDAIRRGAADEARERVLTYWRALSIAFVDLLKVHRLDSVSA